MIARISTYFDCTEDELWKKIIDPVSLQFVAAPVLQFRPLSEGELDSQWIVGKTYVLKLYFFKVLPLGQHRIRITTIGNNTIASNESGMLAPVWNHTIRFRQIEDNRLHYTDEIEIKAGLLTLPVWFFAHLFYRHRQNAGRFSWVDTPACQAHPAKAGLELPQVLPLQCRHLIRPETFLLLMPWGSFPAACCESELPDPVL